LRAAADSGTLVGMNTTPRLTAIVLLSLSLTSALPGQQAAAQAKPTLETGTGPGWKSLGEADFVNVNCDKDTWSFKDGGIQCTGKPTGVLRTRELVVNFELVVEWKHLTSGGNSGVFVWATPESIEALANGTAKRRLPDGIEVQILDHGFRENYLKKNPSKKDAPLFFTTNGDVFPTGTTKMTPFPPTSPNGERSFPKKETTKGHGEWNHYYVIAKNGEIRLTVNGEEVSGGKDCNPARGYLCLESEGAPIEFRNLRIRLLP
jgi:3-keto-disaccharide hydrolase